MSFVTFVFCVNVQRCQDFEAPALSAMHHILQLSILDVACIHLPGYNFKTFNYFPSPGLAIKYGLFISNVLLCLQKDDCIVFSWQ